MDRPPWCLNTHYVQTSCRKKKNQSSFLPDSGFKCWVGPFKLKGREVLGPPF